MVLKTCNFLLREGSQINQIICAVLINFPLLVYGSCIGWMSPMTLVLQSDQSPRGTPFTDEEISWMASAPFITSIPVVVVFGYIVDRFGRKIALLVCTAQFVGCWAIKLYSSEFAAFVVARALVGVGMSGCYVIMPLYTNEISESCLRGTLGTLTILLQTVGNLLLYIVGGMLSYRTTLWFSLALPVVHMFLALALPESPAFLVRKGKNEKAHRVVAWLRCRKERDPSVQEEMYLLSHEQAKESKNFALKMILTDRMLFRALRVTLVLALVREVCGTLPVLHFASDIFSMAAEGGTSLSLSPNEQAMMLGGVQVIGSALASTLIERSGRKPLLLVSSVISGLGMCLLAIWFLLRSLDVLLPGWIPIAALCLCVFCDASGLQPISVVVLGEMFSFKYRSTVNAVTQATSCILDFLQLRLFKPISSAVGVHAMFFFFAAVCLANALYVTLAVPETKMKTVQEIYESMMTEKEKIKYKSKENEESNINCESNI